MNPFSLLEKTILITGASSGIGAQCAIDSSKMGAKVILVARNEERLSEVMSELDGTNHAYYIEDLQELTKLGRTKSFLTEIVREHGILHGFVHAAGIQKTLPVQLLSVDDYEEIFQVNALSAFEFIHHLSSKKILANGGHIVLISSITAIIGRGGVSAYAASKGAMISAARCMALEFAKRQVCINCISPGTILTSLMQEYLDTLDNAERIERITGFPLGLGETTDISSACIYFLSDASRWVTGQNLIVDGGYTVR